MALLPEHCCFLLLWYIGLQRTSPRGIVFNQQSNLKSIPCAGVVSSTVILMHYSWSSLWETIFLVAIWGCFQATTRPELTSSCCFKNIFQDIMYILVLMGIISMWNAAMPLALPVWKLCPELDTSKCIIVDDYYWPVLCYLLLMLLRAPYLQRCFCDSKDKCLLTSQWLLSVSQKSPTSVSDNMCKCFQIPTIICYASWHLKEQNQ